MIGLPLLAGVLAMAISGFAHGEIQGLYRSVTDKLQRRASRKNVSYWLLMLAYVGIVVLLVLMAVRRTNYKKPSRFDGFHPTCELVLADIPARIYWLSIKERWVYPFSRYANPI